MLLEGVHVIGSALDAGVRLKTLVWCEQLLGRPGERLLKRLLSLPDPERTEYSSTPSLLAGLSEVSAPQGMIALAQRPVSSLEEIVDVVLAQESLLVALDNIRDPANVGVICRLVAAVGGAGVVLLKGSADAYSAKAIRASAGAVFAIKLAAAEGPEAFEPWRPLFKAPLRAEMRAEVDCYQADLSGPRLLFLGNEGHGFSPRVVEASTAVSVPMAPSVESINVSMAAAVILYEALRRHQQLGLVGALG